MGPATKTRCLKSFEKIGGWLQVSGLVSVTLIALVWDGGILVFLADVTKASLYIVALSCCLDVAPQVNPSICRPYWYVDA